jgi:hypothetical protein
MIPIRQEPERIPRGLIRISAIAIAIAIAASVAVTVLLARGSLGEVMRPEALQAAPRARIDARLFTTEAEAERIWRLADERLRSYGWVDRGRGVVHVPLDLAAELYLEERAP